MQLYASAASPYARKVRIALIELGLSDRVKVVPTAPTEDTAFRAVNPLGKIPALERDDGPVLYDSLVIIDWLDLAFGSGALIPLAPEARNAELHRHALANGIIDATFNIASERRRPETQRSDFWIARWSDAIVAGAARLADDLPAAFALGAITAVAAIDYIDFRLGDLDLDTSSLSAWRAGLAPRASIESTVPEKALS